MRLFNLRMVFFCSVFNFVDEFCSFRTLWSRCRFIY